MRLQRKNKMLDSRIEICGGIASGKTTFATLMKRIDVKPIYENFKENPFWRAFYLNPGDYIFETEITFLLQHYHQIQKAQLNKKSIMCCDFSLSIDIAYAKMGLKGSKLKTFLSVYNEVIKEIQPPWLLIYLKCDAEAELERIRNRCRSEENLISHEFLDSLNQAIEKQVEYVAKSTKVITIDSAKKNFVDNEYVKKEIINIVTEVLS